MQRVDRTEQLNYNPITEWTLSGLPGPAALPSSAQPSMTQPEALNQVIQDPGHPHEASGSSLSGLSPHGHLGVVF